MESMREIRNRMTSVQKTMKITNAMYLMASSKMKKSRKRLLASEPYFNKLQDTITDILVHTNMSKSSYFAANRKVDPDEAKHWYIVITSDRGLAGAYNHNVIKLTETQLEKSKNNTLLFIGYAGHNYFAKRPELANLDIEHSFAAVTPDLYRARSVAEHIIDKFRKGELDEVHLIYTKMRNALTADTEIIQLLPMTRDMFPSKANVNKERKANFEELYDPSREIVLDQLVPNYVKGLIYGAMIEAYASEQNARMTAMDNATENAKELVNDLSLLYNRVRQSAITTELAEVISGANAQES